MNQEPWYKTILSTVQDSSLVQILLLVVGAYLVGKIGGAILAATIRRTVVRLRTDKNKDDLRKRQDTLVSIIGTLYRVIVWFVAVIWMLRVAEVDLAPLLAGVSVIGVALGFGTQSLVKDILAGTFIVMENQYRVGDIVNLDGSEGEVEHISMRSTTLRDGDGNVHRIPNGTIQRVINKTMGFSNVNLIIAIPSSTNLNKTTKIINEVGKTLAASKKWRDKILDTPRFTNVGSFSGGALEVKVVCKTQPSYQWEVSADLRKRLLAAFREAAVEVSEIADNSTSK